MDDKLIYSDKQAITAACESSNKIRFTKDPSVDSPDPGTGRPVYLDISVAETFNNLTSLKVEYQDSADGSSWSEVFSRTVLLTGLAAGAKIFELMALPKGVREHTRCYYTPSGTAPTTGKVNSKLKI